MVTRPSAMVTVLLSLATVGCEAVRPRGNEEVPPQLTFEKLQFRVFRGALLTAEGEAAHAAFRRDTADLTAERIAVRFPATPTQAESHITAAHGSGNVREHRFVAGGGIRAEQAGQVATTAEAHYAATDGLVRGDQPVKVRASGLTVRGPGFTLDPKEQVLHIEGGAHVVTREGGR